MEKSLNQVSSNIDPEVRIALETLLRLCTKEGILFSGMMMRLESRPFVSVVGNQKEQGADMAELFRQYAVIIDDAVAKDRIEECTVSRPN